MRHGRSYRKLNKATDQRIALLRSLALNIIKHGKIKTTSTRAKEVRKFVERLIALAKKGGLSNLRLSLSLLPSKTIVTAFFRSAPERFKGHTGGCTRMTALENRRGDDTKMVLIELL